MSYTCRAFNLLCPRINWSFVAEKAFLLLFRKSNLTTEFPLFTLVQLACGLAYVQTRAMLPHLFLLLLNLRQSCFRVFTRVAAWTVAKTRLSYPLWRGWSFLDLGSLAMGVKVSKSRFNQKNKALNQKSETISFDMRPRIRKGTFYRTWSFYAINQNVQKNWSQVKIQIFMNYYPLSTLWWSINSHARSCLPRRSVYFSRLWAVRSCHSLRTTEVWSRDINCRYGNGNCSFTNAWKTILLKSFIKQAII